VPGGRLGYLAKRGGQIVLKTRLLAVQLEVYLKNDLWLANARYANDIASGCCARLIAAAGWGSRIPCRRMKSDL